MRRNNFFLISVLCLLASAFVFTTLSGCGQAKVEKGAYYCPMHPTYTSDKPGDCPICNMKLVKKEAPSAGEKKAEEVCIEHNCTMKDCRMRVQVHMKPGERVSCPVCGEFLTTASGKVLQTARGSGAESGPTVMISPEKQQLIGVKTEVVTKRPLKKTIRASGKIAYDPELMIAQEEFIQALRAEDNIKDSPLADVVERAKTLTDASRQKLRLLGMGDDEIAALEKTRKPQTNLYLPKEGENVWAYAAVYEYEVPLVKVGQGVGVEALSYPGEIFKGRVVSINPVLEASTRTNQIRIEVENSAGMLKPEMFVNAVIDVPLGENLAVSESAVLDTGLRKIVYLSRPGGILESREARLGRKAEGYYEVLGGLKEGDIVITSGNFLIDSESRLQSAAGGAEHKHGQ